MNRKEYLFVDGYNVINDWENLKALSNMQLELARNQLIETMAEYHALTNINVTVVFDAYKVKANPGKKESIKGINIVYTKEHQTADAYIEQTIHKIGRLKRVRVATSDSLEQQVILGRGATRISARELKIEIDDYRGRTLKKAEVRSSRDNVNMGKLDQEYLDILEEYKRKLESSKNEKGNKNTEFRKKDKNRIKKNKKTSRKKKRK
ncbi:MAG: NYN domain-containing protein [Andreesenia angusta]|nr:NYN domain-containing protein [Andreesenia angusta]